MEQQQQQQYQVTPLASVGSPASARLPPATAVVQLARDTRELVAHGCGWKRPRARRRSRLAAEVQGAGCAAQVATVRGEDACVVQGVRKTVAHTGSK